jgi:hypothetical protein
MQEGMLAFMRAPRPARSPGNAEESSGLDQAVPTAKATKNSP